MRFCKEIGKEEILNIAIGLVENAKLSIIMTMDMAEELESPLPRTYHQKIIVAKNNGIRIRRFLYGKKRLVKLIRKIHPEIDMFYAGAIEKYQRMLIVDRKVGLFSISGKIFYTEFRPLVKSLLDYVKI